MTVVYHICKPEDEGDYSKGYIGVTDNFEARMDRHFAGYSGAPVLARAVKKYGELSCAVIFSGSREEMLCVEEYYRPFPGIGWNIVAGGGNPPNHKGVPKTQSHKDKISAANRLAKSSGTWIVRGQAFSSCIDAAREMGHQKKSIIKWCKNGLNNCSFIPKEGRK